MPDLTSLSAIFMIVGFLLAAYSIVANDAIQTLGTFLSSNANRPWWILWLYACSILVAVFVYGWVINGGDVSYGRLEKFPEMPITWVQVVPPLVVLILTRYGIPVSTTFLILTVFAPGNMEDMLIKSGLGYLLAFAVGMIVFLAIARTVEARFMASRDRPPAAYWIVLQWCATAFLWSQWLIQDLANIFVYLPRHIGVEMLAFAIGIMLLLHAYIFYTSGGAIQKIVTSKTNTTDIRSATIVDFIYAFILLFFKEYSNMPMSTTWVFLGLLAGREFAIVLRNRVRPFGEASKIVLSDAGKALIGLGVSVIIAFGLPLLAEHVGTFVDVPAAEGAAPDEDPNLPMQD